MRVGSLFAGIGGFDLGFERAGMHTAWQVELDPYCRAVLAQHFPDAKRYEDVREVGAHNLAPIDLICGGFPCQDLSVAGKGAGIDGERSGLWSEMWRVIRELEPRYVVIENVPALLSPPFGVPRGCVCGDPRTQPEGSKCRPCGGTVGLAPGKPPAGVSRVLGDLAACGYDAEWDCLPASAFGAPHRRDRIWLVAYPGSEGRWEEARGAHGDEAADAGRSEEVDHLAGGPGAGGVRAAGDGGDGASDPYADTRGLQISPECDGESQRPGEQASQRGDADRLRDDVADAARDAEAGAAPESGAERQRVRAGGQRSRARDLRDAGGARPQGRGSTRPVGDADWWSTEPNVGRVADGVPARVDRLAALGNALVPQIAEWIGRRILDFERGGIAT
jgi:DNA (cytosine-5)-methyltransferase 1